MSLDKIHSLTAHRLGIRNDVLKRYTALKDKGVEEQSARNTAAAQASLYGDTKPRHRAGVYRRELDAMLTRTPVRIVAPEPPKTPPRSHWSLPI